MKTSRFYVGRRLRAQLVRVAAFLLLLPGIAWVLLPASWMFTAAFMEMRQILRFPPELIPRPWVWTNFYEGLTYLPFGRYFLNSIKIAILRVTGVLLASSLAGYAFARLRAPDREILFVLVLSTLMLPWTVTMIPQFVLFKNLGWIDTHKPLIVPAWGGGPFFIFLFRQFFRTIPEEVFEAARLDGCSYFGIYARILMPLSKPVIATAAIMAFDFSWQDLVAPLIFLNSDHKFTLPLGLARFRSTYGASPWNLIMAVSIVVALPPIILFFLGQRYMLSGIVVTEK